MAFPTKLLIFHESPDYKCYASRYCFYWAKMRPNLNLLKPLRDVYSETPVYASKEQFPMIRYPQTYACLLSKR